jgi:methionyl aminopeptidase
MIKIKTPDQIKIMQTGGKMLADTLWEVCANVKPGMTEIEVDTMADKLIKEKGGEAGFKKVEGYHHATCIATNEVVVHGIPSVYVLKEGDIIGIDCGVFYKGFHTDMSETVYVKPKTENVKLKNFDEVDKFLKVGQEALEAGIKQAKVGNRVGDISKAIQDIVEVQNGYSVVRSLVGHGVGEELHEDPEVPGYLQGKIEKTPLLKEGMVIAVEVIYNMGGPDLAFANNDGWTLKTKDDSLAGLFERTLAITANGPLVVTQ